MKKITTTLLAVLSAILLFAQAPQAFKYQAIARDNTGNILANHNVSFRISILMGNSTSTGFPVYVETHDTITSQFGIVNLEIGNGDVVSGVFEHINWAMGLYFIQTEMDENGGIDYQLLGTSQLLSVPFSIQSRSLILTDELGNEHIVSVDSLGNLGTTMITEWVCGDSALDYRDGQKYATVLIGSQCWMVENLNIGIRIDGIVNQTDNDTIEKYCYDDQESNCDTYGGLYQWDETMQYTTISGVQGICPTGWHVPSDHELKVLEGTVDSKYGVGDPMWNELSFRGLDAGLNLKSTNGWASGGNGTDEFGFTTLPGGQRHMVGAFANMGSYGYLWSSTETNTNNAWYRMLYRNDNRVYRNIGDKEWGFSCRCLQDYTNQPPTQPSNPLPGDGTSDIGIVTMLSWTCNDPDSNDLFYKIHFDTDPNPYYDTAGITDNFYDPGILNYNTTYYWKVTAFDSFGDSVVSNIWSFTTGMVFTCGNGFVDARDGQSYNSVLIGTQCWMAENLNIGTRIDGTLNQTQNSPVEFIEKYCYDDLETSCDTYGGMYQWNEMMQYVTTVSAQGVCPYGWHIPADSEWTQMVNILGGESTAGEKMKEEGTTHWLYPNEATNESGFTALPGGRNAGGSFLSLGTLAYFYTSSEDNPDRSWYLLLGNSSTHATLFDADKGGGFSVRCLMD